MTNPTYKPIATWYKGQQFRSKLEACWGVFFTELELRFEYELDAFVLPSGNYLPDFFLPDVNEKLGTWVEIKAVAPTIRERQFCRELCDITGRDVVLIWGQPMTHVDTIVGNWRIPNCVAFGWVAEHQTVVAGEFPTPITWWSPDTSAEEFRRAAIDAHRAVRWDPVSAATNRADAAWQRRAQ